MAFPSPHRKFNASLSLDRRPRLLKDFLNEDHHYYSCSSSHGFQSYPRKPPCKFPATSGQLMTRSRSSKAAATTISALHKVINIVKFFPFASVKSPSILPRSISRKLSRMTAGAGGKNCHREGPTVMFKVKDILRWRSSRDLLVEEEEKSTPLDYDFSYNCTTTTTTTTTTSKRSSWCDSDFTAEDLPSWCGEIDEHATVVGGGMAKVGHEGVGGYFMEAKMEKQTDPQVEMGFDENEQYSPVSVLESPFREKIRGAKNDDMEKHMMIHLTDITSCSSDESYEWEMEEKRGSYIKDMENAAGKRWYNFDEEKEEICRDLELEVFRDLVNEVLVELFH